jgi:hypothetical protein
MGEVTRPFDDRYKKLDRKAFDKEVVRVNGKLAALIDVLGAIDDRTLGAYPALETASHVLIDVMSLLDKQRRYTRRPGRQKVTDDRFRELWNQERDKLGDRGDHAAAVKVADATPDLTISAILDRAESLHLLRDER